MSSCRSTATDTTCVVSDVQLVTLNLWNLNAPLRERMERAAAWIEAHRPDIVVMQEVCPIGGRTQAHAVAPGYEHVHFDRATGSGERAQGLAVATDLPLTPLDPVELPEVAGDERRILQQVEVASEAGPLRVANTHLAWRLEDEPGRVRQAAAVGRALADCPEPVVLAGDLNDVHGSPPLRELEDTGLTDVCSDEEPTFAAENPWTWQVSLFDRRIDHVLLRGAIDAAGTELVMTGEDAGPVSDHYGVSCRLAPGEPG